MDLALEVGPQPDQLGAVAHPAAQLSGRGWGDPRLGKPAHAQQIRQVRGVAFVVLDPPQREHLHPQRLARAHVNVVLARVDSSRDRASLLGRIADALERAHPDTTAGPAG